MINSIQVIDIEEVKKCIGITYSSYADTKSSRGFSKIIMWISIVKRSCVNLYNKGSRLPTYLPFSLCAKLCRYIFCVNVKREDQLICILRKIPFTLFVSNTKIWTIIDLINSALIIDVEDKKECCGITNSFHAE